MCQAGCCGAAGRAPRAGAAAARQPRAQHCATAGSPHKRDDVLNRARHLLVSHCEALCSLLLVALLARHKLLVRERPGRRGRVRHGSSTMSINRQTSEQPGSTLGLSARALPVRRQRPGSRSGLSTRARACLLAGPPAASRGWPPGWPPRGAPPGRSACAQAPPGAQGPGRGRTCAAARAGLRLLLRRPAPRSPECGLPRACAAGAPWECRPRPVRGWSRPAACRRTCLKRCR